MVLLVLGVLALAASGMLLNRKDLAHSILSGLIGLGLLAGAILLLPLAKKGSPASWNGWSEEHEIYRCEAVINTNAVVLSSLKGKLSLIQYPYPATVPLTIGKWYQATKETNGAMVLVSFPPTSPPQLAVTNTAE